MSIRPAPSAHTEVARVRRVRNTPAGLAVRGAAALVPIGFLAVAELAAGSAWSATSLVAAVGIALLALPTAMSRSDTHLPLLVSGALLAYWWVRVDDRLTAWSVAAAVLLLAYHVAIAGLTLVPVETESMPAADRRWLLRTGLVALTAPAAWAVARLASSQDATRVVGLSIGAFAILAAMLLLLRAASMVDG